METEEKESSPAAAGPSGPAPAEEPGTADDEIPGRLLIFNTLVDKFLEGLMKAGSFQRFARCYQKFYQLRPDVTHSIYNQFVSQLQLSIKAEIQEIQSEGNLEELLDSLDKLDKEAGSRADPQWRPSGIPEEDVRSHLVPYLLKQRDYLRKLLKERQQENAKLAQRVLDGRKKINEMRKEIERRQQAWQKLTKSQRQMIASMRDPSDGT
ncbi:polyamine-modulated factor 1 [Pseudophryne corroboree]|uniref:polyamine-modulated factor 1 n=1 Tax=Pseudophryne corroboree TaxID=495146 RepID=UPI0030817D6F